MRRTNYITIGKRMSKTLVYLDMDGVISDFAHEYYKIEPLIDTVKKFHTMVMEHKIFEKLGKIVRFGYNSLFMNNNTTYGNLISLKCYLRLF